jgi:hypothetical protein
VTLARVLGSREVRRVASGLVGALVAAAGTLGTAYSTGVWATALGRVETALVLAACGLWGLLNRRYKLILKCDILDRAFPLKPPTQAPAMQTAAPGAALAPPGTGPP